MILSAVLLIATGLMFRKMIAAVRQKRKQVQLAKDIQQIVQEVKQYYELSGRRESVRVRTKL